MSSNYPPAGGMPARPCLRCGAALPPQDMLCRNCGFNNAPAYNTMQNSAPGGISSPSQRGSLSGFAPTTNTGSGLMRYANQPSLHSSAPEKVDQGKFPPSQSPWSQSPANSGQSSFGPPPQFPQSFIPPSPTPARRPDQAPPASGASRGASFPERPPIAPGSSMPGFSSGVPHQGRPASTRPVTGDMTGYGNNQPQTFSQMSSTSSVRPGTNSTPLQPSRTAPAPGVSPSLPAQRSSRSKAAIVLAGLAALLILAVLAYAGYGLVSGNTDTTSTSQTTGNTAKTNSGSQQATLFADTFENNNQKWLVQSDPGIFSVAVGNRALTLEDSNNKILWESLPTDSKFSDFHLTVDATLTKGEQKNGYGVYIRGASNDASKLATYYRFEVYGDGTYAILKGTVDGNGKMNDTVIVNYTSSPAIQKQGSVNHIAIVAKGSTITCMVNNQILHTFTDDSYKSGSIALFVSNVPDAQPGAQVQFSNLAIYPVS